jgi:hypothetical protein
MTFTQTPVTRFGRRMVLLSLARKGGPLPIGYFLPGEVASAKARFLAQTGA